MKKFWVNRKDFGLKFGSREVSLTEALKYPVYNPVQRKSVLPQSSEALKSGLTMSGSKRNYLLASSSLKAVRKFPAENEDSGLKSGSRERYLPQSFEAHNIRFKIPVQEEFISCKKLKIDEEDLLPRCAVQTWVSRLTGLPYY